MSNSKSIKTYYLETLGCPKNEVDSEAIESNLQSAGLRKSDDAGSADLVIVNSCGFIRDAKIESIHAVLDLNQARKQGSLLALCGCLPVRYRLQRSLDEVDIFLPWNRHDQLIPKLREIGWRIKKPSEFGKRVIPSEPFAYLKISEGCDNRCAYCAIPDIKGPFVSRPLSEITGEAEYLCENGVKELVLIGQDTSLYGRNAPEKTSLPVLLERLSGVDGCEWIRIMYAHPAHLSDETIETIAACDKIVKYLDLPLQHINDRILKRMNRKVGRQHIERLIAKLHRRVPSIVLRTTFIVGFPGETDGEFAELLDFCESIRFDNVGVFKYSPEDGTPAYKHRGRLQDDVVEERYLTLIDVQNMISRDRLAERVNRKERVLLYRVEPDGTGYARGWFQAPDVDGNIMIKDCTAKAGKMIDVIIERSEAYDLYAKPLKKR